MCTKHSRSSVRSPHRIPSRPTFIPTAEPYAIIASRAATVSYISTTCPLGTESFGNEPAKSSDRQQKDSKNDSRWTTETVVLSLTTSFKCEKSRTSDNFILPFLPTLFIHPGKDVDREAKSREATHSKVWFERGLLVAASLVLVYPSPLEDVIGLTLFALAAALQYLHRRAAAGRLSAAFEIPPTFGSGPAANNQAADETLQSFPFSVFKLHKF